MQSRVKPSTPTSPRRPMTGRGPLSSLGAAFDPESPRSAARPGDAEEGPVVVLGTRLKSNAGAATSLQREHEADARSRSPSPTRPESSMAWSRPTSPPTRPESAYSRAYSRAISPTLKSRPQSAVPAQNRPESTGVERGLRMQLQQANTERCAMHDELMQTKAELSVCRAEPALSRVREYMSMVGCEELAGRGPDLRIVPCALAPEVILKKQPVSAKEKRPGGAATSFELQLRGLRGQLERQRSELAETAEQLKTYKEELEVATRVVKGLRLDVHEIIERMLDVANERCEAPTLRAVKALVPRLKAVHARWDLGKAKKEEVVDMENLDLGESVAEFFDTMKSVSVQGSRRASRRSSTEGLCGIASKLVAAADCSHERVKGRRKSDLVKRTLATEKRSSLTKSKSKLSTAVEGDSDEESSASLSSSDSETTWGDRFTNALLQKKADGQKQKAEKVKSRPPSKEAASATSPVPQPSVIAVPKTVAITISHMPFSITFAPSERPGEHSAKLIGGAEIVGTGANMIIDLTPEGAACELEAATCEKHNLQLLAAHGSTVEAWVLPISSQLSSQSEKNPLISRHAGNAGWELRLLQSGGASFVLSVSGIPFELSTVGNLGGWRGGWTHVAGVREGKTLRIYIGGECTAEGEIPKGAFTAFDGPLLLGRNAKKKEHAVCCRLHSVRVTHAALAPGSFLSPPEGATWGLHTQPTLAKRNTVHGRRDTVAARLAEPPSRVKRMTVMAVHRLSG
eukprot:gnl/TRDRNA2_/TRDRNA2_40576_c0_seq1.p1 gnl/TRDRNA2_/TRDRNA2_40576_c0~~gnl/TRDRNA2_/TRDRNA2_40576_c0_seq1.p1  ORF type:complete len:744 (-),score=97.42 gnl/TRDRNA2_/TRDRNA2_40576_c0_seq1:17-2248(-)